MVYFGYPQASRASRAGIGRLRVSGRRRPGAEYQPTTILIIPHYPTIPPTPGSGSESAGKTQIVQRAARERTATWCCLVGLFSTGAAVAAGLRSCNFYRRIIMGDVGCAAAPGGSALSGSR